MGRVGTAFRLFFRALGNEEFAERGARLLDETPAATVEAQRGAALPPVPAARAAPRSEAITLLAVLQREARLIDFLKENIAGYADAQVGAAVRDVHRDAAAALDRLFALRPVMGESEGSPVQVPAGADAARMRIIGNVTGQPPFRGTLRHGGWEAAHMHLPEWNGTAAAANVIAPAEVEIA